ncbi:lethal(3)malignant brain tumor-like protein 3 [Platysternon megacephalum]|uniref:Lethal(3)malignant brain tumor-like protein 3 n=1 Tax=Platysternon megacephalum TaxID=55544 RepID=A0A4D9E776_9SAUR|nr:lethal(3)malignant brain tumor-like protein 3 [Platysternon megacephalum]
MHHGPPLRVIPPAQPPAWHTPQPSRAALNPSPRPAAELVRLYRCSSPARGLLLWDSGRGSRRPENTGLLPPALRAQASAGERAGERLGVAAAWAQAPQGSEMP